MLNRGIQEVLTTGFVYPPSPQILHWLSSGQLANRLSRSVRLWVLLSHFYGSESNWARELPQKFGYPEVRDRLFASTHGRSDQLSAKHLVAACHDPTCVCHKPLKDWVFAPESQSASEWQQAVRHLTGLSVTELEQQLHQHPFATVHRSVRDDLKQLASMGWLQPLSRGQYQCRPAKEWPTPSASPSPEPNFAHLSLSPTWELLRVLESISFVQPNLELVVRALWEQLTDISTASPKLGTEPQQRIFIHLDYILSPEIQDQVDNYLRTTRTTVA